MTDTIDHAATETDAATAVANWLSSFEEALTSGDAEAAGNLFLATGFWRDLVAFTWNIKTVEGPEGVKDLVASTAGRVKPSGFRTTEEPTEADGVTDAWIAFETEVGRGSGHLRLKEGKAWTLLTTLDELKGHEEPKRDGRPMGAEHGAEQGAADLAREAAPGGRAARRHETQPYVVIIGGGQGGIALGARLRQLGVPTIIIERNQRPGDSWRKRYKSLCLHDPVWYDHLPYIDFPENWPVFSPKDKIGDWLESYTKVMELNYWSSTEAKSARYDEEAGEWHVVVASARGRSTPCAPSSSCWRPGMSGKPSVPDVRGHGGLQGRPAPLLPAPGPRRLQGQEGRRHRLEQLGARHLRRAVGERRRT